MSNYLKILPDNPHFIQNGLKGYKYNIETERLGLYIEISHKGLDKYVYDKESTHIYYVLEGKGKFSINQEVFDVKQGDVIGKTGTSQLEPDSGNVVHFEVMKDNNKLNPEDVINTKLGDL